MNTDFENLVAYYILATAWEKCGRKDIADELWETITGIGDTIITVSETQSDGLFEKA